MKVKKRIIINNLNVKLGFNLDQKDHPIGRSFMLKLLSLKFILPYNYVSEKLK